MFNECKRLLKEFGFLALTTPNATSIDVIGNVLRKRSPFQYPLHVREYTKQEIVAMAARAGLGLVAYRTFFAWNAREDINRDKLMIQLAALGYELSDRGDDAAYLFKVE